MRRVGRRQSKKEMVRITSSERDADKNDGPAPRLEIADGESGWQKGGIASSGAWSVNDPSQRGGPPPRSSARGIGRPLASEGHVAAQADRYRAGRGTRLGVRQGLVLVPVEPRNFAFEPDARSELVGGLEGDRVVDVDIAVARDLKGAVHVFEA